MYAIFRDGSHQYRAEKGATIDIQKQGCKPGDTVEFKDVLLISDGEKIRVGAPTVNGAKVIGELVKEYRGVKIRDYYYRRRKGFHRTKGHRQTLATVKITEIVG